MRIIDEDYERQQDENFWLSLPPMEHPAPGMTGKDVARARWLEGTQRAREQVQAPVVVDGETYIGIVAAARITGYGENRLRVFVRDGTLTKRGVRYVLRPRSDGDRRAPAYLCEADLVKITKGAK